MNKLETFKVISKVTNIPDDIVAYVVEKSFFYRMKLFCSI